MTTELERLALLERAARACFASFSRLPGAVTVDDGEVFGVATGVPLTFFNGVAFTRFPADRASAGVARVAAGFRARGRAFRWWVTPASQPPELAAILQEHGLRHAVDGTGMTAELADARFDAPSPLGLLVRRIADRGDLAAWVPVFAAVFDRSPAEAQAWLDAYVAYGFGGDSAWSHFVGFVDGTPVAISSVLVSGDLAGIYHVGVLAAARGRGIGAAVTTAALAHARAAGATQAALQSSPVAVGVYRALGFAECGPLSLYDWKPSY